MAVAPGEVSDQTIVHPGMVAGMSTRISDSGDGGRSVPTLAGSEERAGGVLTVVGGAGGGAVVVVVMNSSVDSGPSGSAPAMTETVDVVGAASDDATRATHPDAMEEDATRSTTIVDNLARILCGVTRSTVSTSARHSNEIGSNTPANHDRAVGRSSVCDVATAKT